MDSRIRTYIDRILLQVINTGAHETISDEISDHLLCLVDTYHESGHDEEEAIIRALDSFGEPKTLGKQLNNVWFPQLKWLIIWTVLTIGLALFYVYQASFEDWVFIKFTHVVILLTIVFESTVQLPVMRYFYHYFKRNEVPLMRVYQAKKLNKNSISYIEKLTNRLALILMIVFMILLSISTFGALTEGQSLLEAFSFIGLIFIFLRLSISLKMMKSPIVIVDDKGIWIQGATFPVLKWHKIKGIDFKTNYKKQYVCEISRYGNKQKVIFASLAMDKELILGAYAFHAEESINNSNVTEEMI